MSGYTLGQPYGHGRTEQSTVMPGQQGAPVAPASGDGYSFALERYDRWRLIAVSFTLVTAAGGGSRFVAIEYPAGDGVLDVFDLAGYAHAAATTVHYAGGINLRPLAAAASEPRVNFPLSGLWLEAGRSVAVDVDAIAAGDQLSNLRFTFDRTLVHDDGTERIRRRERENELVAEFEALRRG